MTRTPQHHPDEEMLAAYAAGLQAERHALVVATHMALCPLCRRRVRALESVGGQILDTLDVDNDAASADDAGLERLWTALEALDAPSPPATAATRSSGEAMAPLAGDNRAPTLPEPLRSYVGGDVDTLPWKRRMPGVLELELELSQAEAPARLVRMAPFIFIPRHDHHSGELTLVLSGGLRDDAGVYERGDLSIGRPGFEHAQQVLPGAPCYALAVNDAPLIPRTLLGKVLARITGL